MKKVIQIEKARLDGLVKRGFRNWRSQFKEDFGLKTCLSHLSPETLISLAKGRDRSTFYLYDLIMNLQNLGSGFEFNELNPKEKMAVMDRYLFLIDRIRFELMKRLGWFTAYPGEDLSIVELIIRFDQLGPELQAKIPFLSRQHTDYKKFCNMNAFERGEFIRKLIPEALKRIQNHATTL